MKDQIKKITTIVTIIIIIVIFVYYSFFKFKKINSTQETLIPINSAKYNDLQPGVSKIEDITQKLGLAEKETATNSGKILEYKSKNPNFNNEITVQEGTLKFVKQIVAYGEELKISDINKKYGLYEYVLYPPSGSAFKLYVYPSKGIAYIGHQEADILLEIWYFQPTTFEDFKNLYAKEYLDSQAQPGQ